MPDRQLFAIHRLCNHLNKNIQRMCMFIIFIMTSLLAYPVSAATIHANSCSRIDVQTAIDSSSTGDIVNIPAGNCTWNAAVSVPSSINITLRGAGIDLTVINRSPSGGAVTIDSASRVTGFTFNEGFVRVDGDGWRVDHCRFYRASTFSDGVNVRGNRPSAAHPTGLVDHCSFYNTRVLVFGVYASPADNDWLNVLWSTSLGLGTNEGVVYIEDCDFELTVFGNAIDGNQGGAYVFRFNHISHAYIECHSNQGSRGIRRWEIYNNTIDNFGSGIYYPYRLRGGTGVVFNDNINGTWSNYGIALDNVRSYQPRGEAGQCDGDSLWDGNEDATGYPCRDQIGRGPDIVQWVNDPPGTYTQPLVPAYAWKNRTQSGQPILFEVINSSEDHIQEDRDFYNETNSFNGTSGVGVGTYANRPSACTLGVAYWATDRGSWNKSGSGGQGVLYKCVSEDQWELYYTPYTYPHPLIAETETAIEVLPPSELTVGPGDGD